MHTPALLNMEPFEQVTHKLSFHYAQLGSEFYLMASFVQTKFEFNEYPL
jgi:hypothetical protein